MTNGTTTSKTIKGLSKTDQEKLGSPAHQRQLEREIVSAGNQEEEERLRKGVNKEYKERLKTDPRLKKEIESWEYGPSFEEELENYGLTVEDVEFEVQ